MSYRDGAARAGERLIRLTRSVVVSPDSEMTLKMVFFLCQQVRHADRWRPLSLLYSVHLYVMLPCSNIQKMDSLL